MKLSKQRGLMEENRFQNHPGLDSTPSLVTFQLCDLNKPLPLSEAQHFHHRANNTYLESLL